jgi:hypothetical protein
MFLFFGSIAFISCQKGDTAPGCSLGNYGTVSITNTSNDPYDFYLDDVLNSTIKPNSVAEQIHIKEGNGHKLFVKQVSGFVVTPTQETKMLDVTKCNDYSWQIP